MKRWRGGPAATGANSQSAAAAESEMQEGGGRRINSVAEGKGFDFPRVTINGFFRFNVTAEWILAFCRGPRENGG